MNFRLFILSALMLSSTLLRAQTDAISSYFSRYVEDPNFTVVYISGKMFDLMESVVKNIDTKEMNADQVKALRDVVQDMRGLRILTTDVNGLKLYNDAKKTLVGAKPYEVLMTVREKQKNNVDFYVRNSGGVVDELLLLVGQEEGNFTMLSFVGRIDLEKIGALSKAFEEDK